MKRDLNVKPITDAEAEALSDVDSDEARLAAGAAWRASVPGNLKDLLDAEPPAPLDDPPTPTNT